jgi:dolichol kinase
MHMGQVESSAVAGSFAERRRTADRIFRGALIFNLALTLFWIAVYATGRHPFFFAHYEVTAAGVGRVLGGLLFFYVIWGFVWWGIKNLLLQHFVGFTKEERRQAFSSRMHAPFDVAELVSRYSERRIRIVDMIGRRGRFGVLGVAVFFLHRQIAAEQPANFATMFLAENLFDAVLGSWLFLALFYSDRFVAAAYYGAQSRVMDGVLARANCLLITTLWTVFKFVLVPIGAQLARVFPPGEFAPVFALIWGSYLATDAMAEIVGSLIGKQRLRVFGIGDVNRKSVAGTVAGFLASLTLCSGIVLSYGLPAPWLALALVISCSNTLLELFSPRGTDDFTMATANALICWGFGVWIV